MLQESEQKDVFACRQYDKCCSFPLAKTSGLECDQFLDDIAACLQLEELCLYLYTLFSVYFLNVWHTKCIPAFRTLYAF